MVFDKEGQPIRNNDGTFLRRRPSPAMYNTMRQILKDNGIDREPLDGSYDKPAVVDALPFQEPTEINGTPPHLIDAVNDAEPEGR